MKRGLLFVILLALLLAVAACGGEETPAAPAADAPAAATEPAAQQPPAEVPPAATNTPVPPTATPAPPTATPEPAEEEAELSEEQLAALEALDSYRQVVTFSSKGTDADGNPIDNSAEIVTEFTRDPEARRMLMTFVDNVEPSDEQNAMETMETFQIGQDMYMFGGDDVGWVRISTEESPFADPELAMITSGNIFSNLEEMRRVRPDEKIGGIDSRHYEFDEQVLGRVFGQDVGDVTATGDVWIAKDGGFVTKYVLTIEVAGGNGGIFDPNLTNGVIEMSFELQDVNSDITIELPEEAAAGATLAGFSGAFPMPDGSRVQAASANFTILESDVPVAEALAFYDQALAELGWTKDEAGSMSMGDMASYTFTKDGVTLSLLVSLDSNTGKTQIMVNAE
jgi:hypothetical protein